MRGWNKINMIKVVKINKILTVTFFKIEKHSVLPHAQRLQCVPPAKSNPKL